MRWIHRRGRNGWAAAVALAGLACAPALAGGVKRSTPHYEIEAPNEKILDAKARELAWSAAVFEDLFALAPPRGRVILSDNPNAMAPPTPGGGAGSAVRWTLPWFAGSMPGMPAGMGGQMKALTHEAAHQQLLQLVNDGCVPALRERFNGYGSFLPDWVDECVAVYHEPDRQKKERRTQLKASLRKHIPLAEYFTMDHPIGGKGVGGLPPGLRPPGGGGVGGGVMPAGPGMERANLYYVQSLGVIEYLTAVGGKPFFRFAVARMQQGRGMDAILAEWHARFREIRKLVRRARRTCPPRTRSPRCATSPAPPASTPPSPRSTDPAAASRRPRRSPAPSPSSGGGATRSCRRGRRDAPRAPSVACATRSSCPAPGTPSCGTRPRR
ncbi:MAG: hypothetical protein D6776_05195 [Planctomycetota bacterium]|nr:MAG: hypothetical protein D6776_05195 [Planctomycetota bacterium]